MFFFSPSGSRFLVSGLRSKDWKVRGYPISLHFCSCSWPHSALILVCLALSPSASVRMCQGDPRKQCMVLSSGAQFYLRALYGTGVSSFSLHIFSGSIFSSNILDEMIYCYPKTSSPFSNIHDHSHSTKLTVSSQIEAVGCPHFIPRLLYHDFFA